MGDGPEFPDGVGVAWSSPQHCLEPGDFCHWDRDREKRFPPSRCDGPCYRWQRDGDPADLRRGRTSLRETAGPDGGSELRWSIAAALTLAGWDRDRGEWDDAVLAFRTGVTRAEQYVRVQLARDNSTAALR